jgi:thioredoxin-like negative regulator of GroEL
VIEVLLQAEGALSVGLLDRAEVLYQQVVTADPRNSIAVVGLARVALERLDEVGALTLARRALAIDPENNAAQRMVQRLEEVLQARGVASPPVSRPIVEGDSASSKPRSVAPPAVGTPATERRERSRLDRLLRRPRDLP